MKIKNLIVAYPTLFGILVSLVLCAVLVSVEFTPRLDRGFENHKGLIEAVWFSVAFFAVWILVLWRWRKRNSLAFWATSVVLFLFHALGILTYNV